MSSLHFIEISAHEIMADGVYYTYVVENGCKLEMFNKK